MRILSRVATLTESGIEYEGDERHVEICMGELRMEQESKETSIREDRNKNVGKEAAIVSPGRARKFRGITARLNYLGQDRSDIQHSVNELSKGFRDPNEDDWGRIKKVVR